MISSRIVRQWSCCTRALSSQSTGIIRQTVDGKLTPHTRKSPLVYTRLENRAILRANGPDTYSFLHSLLTNDVLSMADAGPGIARYAMLLNTNGRIEHDVMLYSNDPNDVLIECDKTEIKRLTEILMRYKMRKHVQLVPCIDTLQVLALYEQPDNDLSRMDGLGAACINWEVSGFLTNIQSPDPRVRRLGSRIVCSVIEVIDRSLKDLLPGIPEAPHDTYVQLRHRLGVAEGSEEIPPGKALPFECNVDYMSGVSLTKGCYIGQELTARTYHTGVIRKRMLPITPLDNNWSRIVPGSTISAVFEDESEKKNVGVVRAISAGAGLAAMRFKEALVAKELFCVVKDDEETTHVSLRAHLPFWWPRKDGTALAIADALNLHGDSHVHLISDGNRRD